MVQNSLMMMTTSIDSFDIFLLYYVTSPNHTVCKMPVSASEIMFDIAKQKLWSQA